MEIEENSGVACSICLDLVIYGGERSMAKLQCGHEFHLDCIGSAFNMKGTMQCPNCRNIEKGQWLFASSTNSSPEISVEEGSTDAYPFYFSFTDMAYRFHICPFRGLAQVHPSPESSLAVMNTMARMVNHQHPGGSSPHPHGWIQLQHAPFQPHHPLPPGLPPMAIPMPMPIPIGNGAGRFDTQRSLPRFIPPGRVYDPNGGISSPPMNYSHAWVRDNHPHFPLE
ncbi:hypothetical protein vseg_010498 [Gypsophila vaccaria]